MTETEPATKRIVQPSLINRAEVRRKLIQHAADTRHYWREVVKPRVSEATLERIEAIVSREIRSIVEKLPSKGMTI